MRRLALVAAVPIACGLAAATALGQDEPISRTLTVTGKGDNRRAAVVVPVRNSGDWAAPVRIRLMTEQSGVVVTDEQPAPSGLSVSARPAEVPGGETIPVRIRIALPGGAPGAGTMTVAAGPGAPTIVDLGTAPAEQPAAVSAQPASVSLMVTRFCPWKKICEERREAPVWLSPEQDDVVVRQRLAVSGDGDEVTLFLAPPSDTQGGPAPPADSASRARIHVGTDADPRAGTYTASFPFPGADADTAVAATLHVQHWIGWALLTILAGALAGKFLTGPAVDQWRKRQELRISLTQANATYEELRTSVPHGGLYHLYAHFESLGGRKAHLPPDDVDPNRRLGIEKLYADLMAAKGDPQLTALEGRVNGLLADLGAWADVARLLVRLADTAARLSPDYGAGNEVRELLGGDPESLGTADDVRKHTLALNRLADLVTEFGKLQAAWDATEPAKRPREADPEDVYRPTKGPLERSGAEHAELLEQVTTAQKLLAAAGAEPAAARVLDVGGAEAAAGGPEATVEQPGPLRRALQRVDWVLWTVTLLIAVVAFTLTIYVGKDFGGFSDYAAAFVAGFSGAAVANVGLVPLVRALGASAV